MERFIIGVIDDDPDDLYFIKRAIQEAAPEQQVLTFQTGEAFFEYCNATEELPVLVLLDYNMPVQNGEDVLIRMQQDIRLCSIKVAFLSTGMTVSLREQLMDLGAYCCLSKPANNDAYKRIAYSLIQLAQELSSGKEPTVVPPQ